MAICMYRCVHDVGFIVIVGNIFSNFSNYYTMYIHNQSSQTVVVVRGSPWRSHWNFSGRSVLVPCLQTIAIPHTPRYLSELRLPTMLVLMSHVSTASTYSNEELQLYLRLNLSKLSSMTEYIHDLHLHVHHNYSINMLWTAIIRVQ